MVGVEDGVVELRPTDAPLEKSAKLNDCKAETTSGTTWW